MSDSSSLVEQAVYSVKLDSRQNVVNLEQCSPGAVEEDLRFASDLASRVSLLDGRFYTSNMFSFFLPNGTSLIGRLTPRSDRSIRDGEFYFQCLFADFELFCSAGADPLTFMHFALNTTQFGLYRAGSSLPSFRLNQNASLVNIASVQSVDKKVGHRALAFLIQSILENSHTFFVSKLPTPTLTSAVFSLFPVNERRRLSFSTGLFFRGNLPRFCCAKSSGSRTLVLPTLEESVEFLDQKELRIYEALYGLDNPWSVLINEVLTSKTIDYFLMWITNHYDAYVRDREFDADYYGMGCVELGSELLGFFFGCSDVNDGESSPQNEKGDGYEDGEGWSASEDGEQETSFDILENWKKEEDDRNGDEWKSNANKRDAWDAIAESATSVSKEESDSINSIRFFQIEPEPDESGSGESSTFQMDDAGDFSEELEGETDNPFEAETFEEQLKRRLIEQARASSLDGNPDESRNVKTQDVEDEIRRFCSTVDDSGKDGEEAITDGERIALSPFSVLSAEYPENDASLRRLDALVRDVCKRTLNSQTNLERFWKGFTAEFAPDFVDRVREEYLKRLKLSIGLGDEPEDDCNLILGVLDACQILSD